MFMTFIAVSILSAAFITMYLYLTQHGLSATEAQRIYAEAAQERLQALLDRRAGEIIVNNTGGIGVALKYLVCLKKASNTAVIQELRPLVIVPSGGGAVIPIPSNFTCSYPSEELYVMSERGNMFRALPGGFSFEIEASPANVTLSRGGSAEITLKLRAILLETPENGVILIVADPSACRMTNVTTVTRIANITYNTATLIVGRATSVVTVCTAQDKNGNLLWGIITYIADPTTITAANASAIYTTETLTRINDFIAQPEPITLTFTTRTTATITKTMTLGARSLDYWDPSASCYVWFRVMNATGGSRLAEAGVKVLAGPATITTTTTTTTTTTNTTTTTTTTPGAPGIILEPSQGSIDVRKGQSANIMIMIYSVNGYSGYVALSALCESGPACEAGKLSFSFNPGTVYVPAGGYATSTMTIKADKKAPVDSINTVRIIGEDASHGISNSTTITVNVTK
jgi:hypothetical protein